MEIERTGGGNAEEELRREIHAFILEEFLPGANPQQLTYETPLITGGILDSISTVMLVTHLETRYGVSFSAHEMDAEYLDSIDQIARTVSEKRR